MNNSLGKGKQTGKATSRLSAALYVTQDDSLASLLLNRGINVRDFVYLSFLLDRGPMSSAQLASVVGIEPEIVLQSLERLSAAGLVLRKPESMNFERGLIATLTGRGQVIAKRLGE